MSAVNRQLSFSQVDKDASGTVELEEVQSALPQIPSDQVERMFNAADSNKDGKLDRQEYSSFLMSVVTNTENFAEAVVLPRRERSSTRRIRGAAEGLTSPPYKIVKKFPIFIIGISFIEWAIFTHLMYDFVIWLCLFHPLRRYEVWRYVTVMFIHGSWIHLWSNIIMQLILGCLLEVIHHWKRVGIVYVAGVLFGTLASSVVQPWTFLIGASGGVYALLIAHLSTIILNWNEMGCAFLRCFLLLGYIAFDVWLVISDEIIKGNTSDTSHAGHIGGALAGLLVGIVTLKNFEQRDWELKLQNICKNVAIIFVVLTALANFGLQICYFIFPNDQKDWGTDEEFQNVTSYIRENE